MHNKPSSSYTEFNIVTSIASYAISLAVAIAYIPFLVAELGLAAYGMIALCLSLVQYAGPITQAISSTINQRLVISWSDPDRFSSVFSTAVSLCLAFSAAIGLLALLVSGYLEHVINIPSELRDETRWLFMATAAAFTLYLAVMPLTGVIFSRNAIYILNLQRVVDSLARVTAVVVLFTLFGGSLELVAISIILAAAVGAIVLAAAAFTVRQDLKFRARDFSTPDAIGMLKTGRGVIMVQIGSVLLMGSDILIVNLTHGTETGGAYAALAQWSMVLRGLVLSVGSTVTAKIMLDYQALQGPARVLGATRAIRLLTCFAALPAGFVAGISSDLLTVWIGPQVAEFSMILTVLALPVAVNVISVPILAGQLAADRMTNIGYIYVLLAGLFIVTAVSAAIVLDWGGLEVALALALFILIKNFIFLIPMTTSVYGAGSRRAFFMASLYPFVWTVAAALITCVIAAGIEPESFLELTLAGLAVTAFYSAIVMVTLPSGDRSVILGMIRRLTGIRAARQ